MTSFLRRRLWLPLAAQLKQGHTPRKLAQSVAFGVVISCCPLFGATTALGVAAAVTFRLNHPAVQLTNYLLAPVQLMLMVPFFRLGERLFGLSPQPLRPDAVLRLFRADLLAAGKSYGLLALHGAAVWLILAPAAIYLLSKALEPVIERLALLKAGPARPS